MQQKEKKSKQSENITCVSNMYQLRSKNFSIPFFKVYLKLPENIELIPFCSQRGSKSEPGHVCTPTSIPNLCSLKSFQFPNLRFACSRSLNLFNCSCVIMNVFRPLHSSLVKPCYSLYCYRPANITAWICCALFACLV